MLKVISPAIINPGTRSLAEFHRYWGESHGPLFANTKHLWAYVQHLTLPESYDGTPKPTHDGASQFWYEDLETMRGPGTPEAEALSAAVRADDRQLFDRLPGWPISHKRASVVGEERIIVDGPTTPEMVKIILIGARMPGLTPQEFSDHLYEVHGALAAKLPGLRRYVQNHAIPEAYAIRPMTHDAWSELWFDDLASLQAAFKSPEAEPLREDGATLFARPACVIIAREKVQKWDGKSRTDLSPVKSMSEDEIRAKLKSQGFAELAADPNGPKKIKSAAEAGTLMVWSPEHIVTIDDAKIDARPEKVAVS
jgi:uncharacterized protein (TIGR02118 family)